jgi:hypothetical protein
MRLRTPARLLVGLLAAGLAGCATLFPGDEPAPRPAPRATPRPVERPAPARANADPDVVALRGGLAEGARSILGAKQLLVRGRRFTMDCTGVVLACYWYAGIDLARDFGKFSGNGVRRIHKTLERDDLLYSNAAPLVGDIIFWDNTYSDAPLSHVGMVLQVDSDGTVTYIHHHVTKGIITEYMNLRSPGVRTMIDNGQVKVINSPLRLAVAGTPHPPAWLSGQLYRALGMGYLLP